MNRLAKYQIVDDVFKELHTSEGKNHGVTVLVDWSGSISGEVKDILEQTFILAEFCERFRFFRIYLFSDMITKKDYYNEDDFNHLYEDFDGALVEILSNEM